MCTKKCLIDILISLLLLLLLQLSQAELNFNNDLEHNQRFRSVSTTIKTYENDTVVLPCFLDTPFRYVRWHRDNVLLVDSRQPEMLPPERIMLWSNGSLQVAHVRPEDTGDYYCEIMAGSEEPAVQMHAIEVQYAPTVLTEPHGLLELPIGATFEVVCLAKGVPQPAISWRQNGNIVAQYSNAANRQSHIFEIKSRNVSGLIECQASNGVGQPAVSGVYLNVLFVPDLTLPQDVVYTKVGDRAQLECVVESAPVASLYWFHHGVPVQTGWHISSHETELTVQHSTDSYVSLIKHVLNIQKVRESDMGQYECRANNSMGFKGAVVELTGRPMPCIFKLNPGTQSSTSHHLVWQTESLLPIMEFKLKFRQIPSANTTRPLRVNWTELTIPAQITNGPVYITAYTMHGLQPASLFEASVLARNSFGWSDNSKTVRFATGGEVVLPNYSTESELQYDATEEIFDNEITPRSQILTASMMHNSATLCGFKSLSYITIFIQTCLAWRYT